jgi:glycosyltransferase involved in cell wall biosynthesis
MEVNKKKTILFANVGADMYGADYVLLCLVRSLDCREFRKIVIVPYDGPLVRELETADATVIIREFPVLRRSVFTPWGLCAFAWQMLTSLLFTARLATREGIDIFHTNTASLWPLGIVAAIQRKPHIWQVMEIVERPRIVAACMGKMVGLFSTKVFCISDAVRLHFLRNNIGHERKFQTLYHGVDPEEYEPVKTSNLPVRSRLNIPPEAQVILYAGRFSAWKGQDIFARAIPEILAKAKRVDVRFLILGSCFQGQEKYGKELESLIESLNLPPGKVHLHGFQKNLPEWMSASNIFVLPSKKPEPNATVLIGAMAMGLPCIGTNIGGTTETILDNQTGILIPPNCPTSLAKAVLTLIEHPDQTRQMGAAARHRAETTFSISRYCRIVQETYGEM